MASRPAKTVSDKQIPASGELAPEATNVANVPEATNVANVPEATNVANVPEATEQKAKDGMPFMVNDGKVTCRSETRKGKKIFASTGKEITFDEEGCAVIDLADALYLQKCPGFSFKQE